MKRSIFLVLVCLLTFARAEAQTSHGRILTDGISNKQTITITGATPSVSIGNVFLTGNTGATTITNFLGPTDSQQITVICGDTNTTIANNSNIATATGGNITCVLNVAYAFAYNAGLGKWIETGSSTSSASPGGSLGQGQVNDPAGSGTFKGTGCYNLANGSLTGPLNLDCLIGHKDPAHILDLTRFNARATTCGQYAAGFNPTATISLSTPTTVTLNTSACPGGGGTYQNGDYLKINGAGAANGLSTPSAPTIASAIDVSADIVTGYSVAAPAGSTQCPYYILVAIDINDGLSLPSGETTSSTCQPIGTVNTSATASRSGRVTTYTVTSHTFSNGGRMYVSGCSDNSFNGYFNVTSNTPTTLVNNNAGWDTNYNGGGMPSAGTAATGCTIQQDNLVKISLPLSGNNFPAGVQQYLICKSASSGTETPYALSTLNIGSGQVAEQVFEDYGSTISQQTLPPYIPSGACQAGSPQADALYTQIVSGGGTTTLTVSTAASTAVSGALTLQDNSQALVAADAYANAQGGGLCLLPGGVGSTTYYFNSYANVSHCHFTTETGIQLNHTLQFTGVNVSGRLFGARAACSYSGFGMACNPTIQVATNPGLFLSNSTISDVNVNGASNVTGVFGKLSGGTKQNLRNVAFQAGGCGTGFVDMESATAGGFGWDMYGMSFNGSGAGRPCPTARIYDNSQMNFWGLNGSRGGLFFGSTQSNGTSVKIEGNHDWQDGVGAFGPQVELSRSPGSGTLGCDITISNWVIDSSNFPITPLFANTGTIAGCIGLAEFSGYSSATTTGIAMGSILAKNFQGGLSSVFGQNFNIHVMNGGTNQEAVNLQVQSNGPVSSPACTLTATCQITGWTTGGIPDPTVAPTVTVGTSCSNHPPAGTWQYSYYMWDKNGGFTRESPLSAGVSLNGTTQCATVTPPTFPSTAVYWSAFSGGTSPSSGTLVDLHHGLGACAPEYTSVTFTSIVHDGLFFCGSGPTTNTTSSSSIGPNGVTAATLTSGTEFTTGQCFSSAAPATCGSFIDGFVTIAAGSSTVVVDTTTVTANSNISLTFDATQGTALGVTCNTTAQQPYVTARTPGTSFTISVPSNFSANPGCIGFHLKN